MLIPIGADIAGADEELDRAVRASPLVLLR